MSNCWTDCKTAFIVIKPALPPSARRTTTCFPLGAQRDGSVGPNSATVGTFSAAARCVMPESFPMYNRHAANVRSNSNAA